MATTAVNGQLTLLELAKRTNNANVIQIAETLSQVNEILQDAVWMESNQATSHVGTRRMSLPTGTWRRINKGIQKHATVTKQITETMGMLEDYSIVDKRLVELAVNSAAFRSGEDMGFVEGMSQNVVGTLFYGSMAQTPEVFDGFATRYYSSTMPNVILNGGSGANCTSLWIVEWGPTKVHLIYPRGSSIGIKQEDLGVRPAYDANSNPYEAYWTHFRFDAGIFVHDDRCVQRIANIMTSGTANTLNDDFIIQAKNKLPIPNGTPGTRIYVNRTIKSQFDSLSKNKTNAHYTSDPNGDVFGAPVTRYQGIPVRLVDQILNTETAIS